MKLEAKVTMDGPKNVVLVVKGILGSVPKSPFHVLSFKDLQPVPKVLRFEQVLCACQKDLGFSLYWEGVEDGYILPVEGRCRLGLEDFGGLIAPVEATGLAIEPYNWDFEAPFCTRFFLMFDFAKHSV